MRNNEWLAKQLDILLKKYFADVKITNPIEIKFGREAKYRFGSIKLYPNRRLRGLRRLRRLGGVPKKSLITITSMFVKENVPTKVVWYTICHELCHFAHGFSSTNKRLFKYPHHGGIVNEELTRRSASPLIHEFKKWLKSYRRQILKTRVTL